MLNKNYLLNKESTENEIQDIYLLKWLKKQFFFRVEKLNFHSRFNMSFILNHLYLTI